MGGDALQRAGLQLNAHVQGCEAGGGKGGRIAATGQPFGGLSQAAQGSKTARQGAQQPPGAARLKGRAPRCRG